MKLIPLTKGFSSKVDDADFEELSKYKWYYDRYAVRNTRVNGKRKKIAMQNQLMNPPKGMIVDHWNQDKLDNQRTK